MAKLSEIQRKMHLHKGAIYLALPKPMTKFYGVPTASFRDMKEIYIHFFGDFFSFKALKKKTIKTVL